MQTTNIEVKSKSIATRRDGTPIQGTTSQGKWVLWFIKDEYNNQYAYFANGNDQPPYQLNQRYDIEYDTKTLEDGRVSNRIVVKSNKSAVHNDRHNQIMSLLQEIHQKVIQIQNTIDKK